MGAMSIAKNLARLRKAAEMSQTGLAKKAGLSQQLISQIERGENDSTTYLPELARALGCRIEEIDPNYTPDGESPVRKVPLLSWVSAGKLSDPGTTVEAEGFLAFSNLRNGDYFALRVHGDSMDRVSPDGSVIVVDKADQTLVSGKYYIFHVAGETTYKAWQDDDPPYLAPFSTNLAHRPQFVSKRKHFGVVGRVKRTMLDM